jgi:hypothetical protein
MCGRVTFHAEKGCGAKFIYLTCDLVGDILRRHNSRVCSDKSRVFYFGIRYLGIT